MISSNDMATDISITTNKAPFSIPVYRPSLLGNERKYVEQCLDSSWISSKGEFIERFETAFAEIVGASHATAVCNGTVALHLALTVLGIGPGDEVIVPTLTYVASVNAIRYCGATPVFVDSLIETWQMDPRDVKRKITPRTKAVMAVHLYGHPCAMDDLVSICQQSGLFLVEDCAEAFGTKYGDRHVGTFGDVSTFSFFGNKTITTGEGGMVVSRDAAVDRHLRKLKSQGLSPAREYWHDEIGYNYRMTNVAAAIGLAQIERGDELVAKKKVLAQRYRDGLSHIPIFFQKEDPKGIHSHWMFSLLVESLNLREGLREFLGRRGIETRPFFPLVHQMPMYNFSGRFPVAEGISARGLNLPSWPDMGDDDIQTVLSSIRAFYGKENK